MKKILSLLLNIILHLIPLSVILLAFYPFASWYLKSKYLYGIDFYNSISLITFLKHNFSLPHLSWFSYWFGGWPYYLGYPVLHFYLILPLTKYFSIIDATQIYAVITTIFYCIGYYFLFYTLSKNRLLSLVFSLGAMYSIGYYGALLWGGSMPFYFTQSFLPWILLFLFLFLKNNNSKAFFLAIIFSGLSIWGHPQVTLTYIFPAAVITLLLSVSKNLKFFDFKKIKLLLLYLAATVFIGLPFLYPHLNQLKVIFVKGNAEQADSTVYRPPAVMADLKAYHKAQPLRIVEDNYQGLFIIAALSIILGIIPAVLNLRKTKEHFFLAGIILAVYFTFYIWLYAYGISIFHGGWYRLFWSVPVWLGVLAASFWFEFDQFIKRTIPNKILSVIMVWVVSISISMITLIVSKQKAVQPLINPTISYQIIWNKMEVISDNLSAQISSILYPFDPVMFIKRATYIDRGNLASGFPGNLIIKNNDEQKKRSVLPDFIDISRNNTRLYSADQTFNIWWNALFTIPLARGYLDPPIEVDKRGYHFLLDAALNVDPKDTTKPLLTSAFDYPEDIAVNNTRYLIDWNAVEYIQGGGSSAYAGTINDLVDNQDFIEKKEKITIEDPVALENSTLQYYHIKKELYSPIISVTNVPVIGIFASESGYETIIRTLAALDLNSKWLIPVKLGTQLDKYQSSNLSQFDAIILYDYDYNNRNTAFNTLLNYVEKGGNLLIDSGAETKESVEGEDLPEVFPLDKIQRKGIGESWDLKIKNNRLKENIEISKFSPALFDKAEWKFAIPDGEIRDGAEIMATNHDKAVLIKQKIKEGTVIWSGMNLSYHVTRYHNSIEANFYKNILSEMITLNKENPKDVKYDWSNSRKLIVKDVSGKGLLIKEQLFPGWVAQIKDKGKTNIWPAGPAIPGYMYLFLPAETGQKQVILSYNGSQLIKFLWVISILTMIVIFDYILLSGSLVKISSKFYRKLVGRWVKKWWEKEDEEI